MFTFEEYLVGWVVYMALIIGVLAVFWWLTKSIPWMYVKSSLRLIASTILLVPVRVPETEVFWAPAWIVGVLEFIFTGVDAFIPIGQILFIAVVIALLIYCLLVLSHWYFFSKPSA